MRLLRRGDDHDVGEPLRRAEAGPPVPPQGQPLPLHRLPRDRGRDPRRLVGVGGPAGQACGASLRQPACRGDRHRQRALHDGFRAGGDAPPQGRPLAARARADQGHPQGRRRSRCRASTPSSPGRTCRGGPTRRPVTTTSTSTPTTPTCSTTSRGSSASGSPPSSPRPRLPRRRPAGWWRSTTRCSRPCSTPSRPCYPALRRSTAARRSTRGSRTRNGTSSRRSQAETGDVAAGIRRGRRRV